MRIPELKLHKASGRYFVNWRGARVYFGSDKERAERAHRAWLAEQGLIEPVRRIQWLSDLLLFGLEEARKRYPQDEREWSEYDQMRNMTRAVTQILGDLPIEEFGPLALLRFRDGLLAKPVSARYAAKQLSRLKRMVEWAIGYQLLPRSALDWLGTLPAAPAKRDGSKRKERRQPVDDSDIERTLPLLGPVVAAMVRFQRLTGVRPQNLCALTAGQLDRETFADQGVWVYWPDRHKSDWRDKDLAVMIGPRAQALIAPLLGDRPAEAPLFSPQDAAAWRARERREKRRTPLTPSQLARTKTAAPKRAVGTAYDTRTYRRAIRRAIDRFNAAEAIAAAAEGRDPRPLPRWHPYQIRHRRATELRSDKGLEAAQVILGHSKADVTAIYTHRDLTLAARIAFESG